MSNLAKRINLTPPTENSDDELKRWIIENFLIVREILKDGVDGTFISTDTPAKTITVEHGIVVNIVES